MRITTSRLNELCDCAATALQVPCHPDVALPDNESQLSADDVLPKIVTAIPNRMAAPTKIDTSDITVFSNLFHRTHGYLKYILHHDPNMVFTNKTFHICYLPLRKYVGM